jgi:LysM repeat protein
MRGLIFLCSVLCIAHPLYARPQSGFYTSPELDELRIELDDLKHALKTTQVEFNLLDERLKKQDRSSGKESLGSAPMSALEKKVEKLEKTLEKVSADLRTLNANATQALSKIQLLEQDFASHEKQLQDVVKLKGTLTSISKAIGQKPITEPSASQKTYRVKAGDSLEKIARNNQTTADAIRKINTLSTDKIVIGQELRLPDGPS